MDTIFYDLKIKRTKKPIEVFQRMKKYIDNKRPAKQWLCQIDEDKESMLIDFGDNKNETFVLSFIKGQASYSCKVDFPLEGENFDNENKSEFKTLLNMIYSARTLLSEMNITDDYGLADDFMESKKYKIAFRELSDYEMTRVKFIFDLGFHNHTDFILAHIYESLHMPFPFNEDIKNYVDYNIPYAEDNIRMKECWMIPVLLTYLCMTSEYKNEGPVVDIPDFYGELNAVWFSSYAFAGGIEELYQYNSYFNKNNNRSFGTKHSQIRSLYKNKFLPLLEREDNSFNRCVLSYRFFVSIYDYCGFVIIGKETK